MKTKYQNYSYAVFPYLKTSNAVSIGQLTFSSTCITNELKHTDYVNDIARMLFLQDNLRIKSATYAPIPFIDMNHPEPEIEQLKNIQAVVAYCYASPRHEFGDVFLSPEHASMAVFSPGRVFKSLVYPSLHVEEIQNLPKMVADKRGEIDGYAGLYNFKHHFWVTKGSRLYGPKPHLTLNISQDLSLDIARAEKSRCDYRLLFELLRKSATKTSKKVFTALQWFNTANSEANDSAAAIVDLSIAFEALMNLPSDQKSERLTDAISLLLGRIMRLNIWAMQFYDARSQIVHEGNSQQLNFIATDSTKNSKGQQYQSLLSYGRQIFQLCLGTLLTGAELAEKSGLEEKFITNEERFQEICRILDNSGIGICERLESIFPIVEAINQYRYIPESNLKLETMIGATRLAAKTLLKKNEEISNELQDHLSKLINTKRTIDHFKELDVLRILESDFQKKTLYSDNIYTQSVKKLIESVWQYTFMHYFWIKKHLLDDTKDTNIRMKKDN